MPMLSNNVYLRSALSIVLLALLPLSFSKSIDSQATAPLDASFNRALITFGVVRGINAVVSVVQGTEVAIEPGGVGVVLTPGEILDPVNDLIEQFSWIVLAASTSLGAQKILIEIGTTPVAQIAFLLAVMVLLTICWMPAGTAQRWRSLLLRFSLVILLLRFLVPVVVLANELVYSSFLSEQYQSSYQSLEQTEREVQALQAEENLDIDTDADDGFFTAVGRWYNRTTQRLNVSARFAEYESRLENASEQIVNLIVVFVLQTLIFPLMFLWFAIRFGKAIVSSRFWSLAPGSQS